MMNQLYSLLAVVAYFSAAVSSTTIAEIQGNQFTSPLVGQTVSNVSGIVTAKVGLCL